MIRNVLVYKDSRGKEPFYEWLNTLDKSIQARIENRVLRIRLGNYGDFKKLSGELLELRLHFGSGYRIYFGEDGDTLVILLCGGDKKTQSKDIKKAESLWQAYLETKI